MSDAALPRMSPHTYEQIALCIVCLETYPMSSARAHELLEKLCQVAFADGGTRALMALDLEPKPL